MAEGDESTAVTAEMASISRLKAWRGYVTNAWGHALFKQTWAPLPQPDFNVIADCQNTLGQQLNLYMGLSPPTNKARTYTSLNNGRVDPAARYSSPLYPDQSRLIVF